jgi:ATP-dependent DNA helicase RecQ
LNNEALKVLTKYWGHSSFRPLQLDIITSVINNTDTLALLPTGGGKSITFQIPALLMEGMCIVVSPLIALMKDQVQNLKRKGIPAGAIYSGMHSDEIESVYNNCIHNKFKFLYVSPERLETEAFRHLISLLNINLLAIDEAHCISQWGYDFRPPYLKIAEVRDLITNTPILALTATATPNVVNDIMEKLRFKKPNVLKASFLRKNLSYGILKENDKASILIRILKKIEGSGIVYVRSRKKCRELAEILHQNNIASTYYHAGLTARERTKRQEMWSRNQIRIMVSTNAFGMGIDKSDVSIVIHYDLPDSIESYFQEAGRAGRNGKSSRGIVLYKNEDINNSIKRLKSSFPEISQIKKIYNALGNYFQIPEGSGKDVGFDFNLAEFCKHFNLKLIETYNAIKILEKEGFIFFIESSGQYSQIMLSINKMDLYRFQIENPGSDRLIKEILRSYSGIFTEFVNINENLIASRTNIDRETVVKKLSYLHKLKILKYLPIRTSPQIVFTSERLGIKNIELQQVNYINQKNSSEKRLQALLDFLSNSLQCRSQQLLSYFGETKSQRCGICDVCNRKSEVKVNDIEFDLISKFIKESLKQENLHLYELVAKTSKFNENNVIATLQWLIEHNKVVRTKDETLLWHEQLDIGF